MMHRLAGIIATTAVGLLVSQAGAALVAPVKPYVKTDEPIIVRLLNEKGEEGKKAVQELGLSAAKLTDLFEATASAGAESAIKMYTATGEAMKVASVKGTADGTVDVGSVCPQVRQPGVYFLVWKDAPPLVIETLCNPGRGPVELARARDQIDRLPPEQKKEALSRFGPVVTHMELASQAVITTDKGVIKAKFAYDAAPHTIDNFITLARQGFYDGSGFHRIISGFMIQGGDAYAFSEGLAGSGGPGYEIMHEFSEKKHERGSLSMARSSDPDSAGSQFFVMHGRSPNLDGQYSAFGDVIEGMDVVDAIAKTPVSDSNGTVRGPKPKIISIRILPATAAIYGLKE